jgi:BirA family transcriptional regulator, biotin operon repressor / biotin---[acetyl-CoA-carboxylase] ligase
VLHRVALPLVRALLQFEREGFAAFASAYERRDLLRGLPVVTIDPARAEANLDGVAEGVGAQGALRVRSADGTLTEVSSGDVSVRLASG